MGDHDQRFKALLREYFSEFMNLFFPVYAEHFDFGEIEWLEQEVFADPPHGDVRKLDIVALLKHRDPSPHKETLALIHVEVESRSSVATFHRRMYRYYESLRRKHECPVLPIALFMRVGLDGIGVGEYDENFEDIAVLQFRYLYVGLPAMDAKTHLTGENWLGVGLSALMRMPNDHKALFRAEALRRILVESNETAYRKLLLTDCIEAYLVLDEEQQSALEQILQTESYKEVISTMQTTYDKGIEHGRREDIMHILNERFESVPERIVDFVMHAPSEQLTELLTKAMRVATLDDFC